MVRGFCYINKLGPNYGTIKEAESYSWPTVFTQVPVVGDFIKANSQEVTTDFESKPRIDDRPFCVLKVKKVTRSSINFRNRDGVQPLPQVEIELSL